MHKMVLRTLAIFYLFAGLSAGLLAQEQRALLWRVEQAGREPSYLFGTIHSDDPRVTRLPPAVERALDQSDALVLEMLLDPGQTTRLAQRLFTEPDNGLAVRLPEPLYQRTVAALAQKGLDRGAADRLYPWSALLTLSSPPLNHGGRFLDQVLYERAAVQGLQRHGLESLDEQLSVFAGLSEADKIALLEETLKQLPEFPALYEAMIAAYLRRDLDGLVVIGEMTAYGSDQQLQERLRSRLLDERNRRMLQRMQLHLEKGSAFVAIGALHLPGENGLLTLLEQQGYRLTPVY